MIKEKKEEKNKEMVPIKRR